MKNLEDYPALRTIIFILLIFVAVVLVYENFFSETDPRSQLPTKFVLNKKNNEFKPLKYEEDKSFERYDPRTSSRSKIRAPADYGRQKDVPNQ